MMAFHFGFGEKTHTPAEPIMKIMNSSLEENNIPERMKMAKITPTPEDKKLESPSDNRPIYVTLVIARFVEGMITQKFFIPRYNEWLFRNQQIFRTSASTTAALISALQ